ncbi:MULTISPECIES: type IV pilin-like G/H family protein [unclassified Microcoleus]|uniref:type IV pilin-like G/H family protein n=1 Tax=unclassified Microcoleus TaxID=2642155 RepID=UPI002FD55E8A
MKTQNYKSKKPGLSGCKNLLVFMLIAPTISMSLIWISNFMDMKYGEFSRKAHQAKNSEAKAYIGSINKGQQAYFAKKSTFTTSLDALEIGLKAETETSHFKYSAHTTKKAVFNYALCKDKSLKNYVGGVFVVLGKNKTNTISILCGADSPGTIKPAEPTYQNGKLICGKGTTEVTK